MLMQGSTANQRPGHWILPVIFVAIPVFICQTAAASDPDPPAWAGEPGRVRHLYTFPTNSMEPVPAENDNPFGEPGAIVALGEFAGGWQDWNPDLDPPQSAGESGTEHGAWDLGKGPEGSVTITLPIRNIAGGYGSAGYDVKLYVNAVGYTFAHGLPSLAVMGYSMTNLTKVNSFAFNDPVAGQWMNRTWNARIEEVMDDHITIIMTADQNSMSLIDTIEVYALATDHIVWEGDGKSPVWWAELVGKANGAALTVYEGYLMNQQDLNRPFRIIDFGFDKTGRPVASWKSSGLARGTIKAMSGKHLADEKSWITAEGSTFHDNGISTWKGVKTPSETNFYFRFRIVPE